VGAKGPAKSTKVANVVAVELVVTFVTLLLSTTSTRSFGRM
jgi:hypothetical protein